MVSQEAQITSCSLWKRESCFSPGHTGLPCSLSQHFQLGLSGQPGKKGNPNPEHLCYQRGFCYYKNINAEWKQQEYASVRWRTDPALHDKLMPVMKLHPNKQSHPHCTFVALRQIRLQPQKEEFAFSGLNQVQLELNSN